MAVLDSYLKANNTVALSKKEVTFTGQKYRITILSELLIRLEYQDNGEFEDRPTELAIFRDFPVPEFGVSEDDRILEISTKYFKLKYRKDSPFKGGKLTPDSNLRIALNGTDKVWYYGHPEARNFYGAISDLEGTTGNAKMFKGLYSTDGFCSIDDSTTLIKEEDGYLRLPDKTKIDIYVFMYKRDFGNCLRDYFRLTGKPPLIPRYALGIWWNRNVPYSFDDLKELITNFNKDGIPLSVLLLGEAWHLKDSKDLSLYKTGFTFNKKLISKPDEFTKYMHDRGIRVGININPEEGIYPHEEAYSEIVAKLGMADAKIIPFNVFDRDFINIYFHNLIEPLKTYGVDFFWIDYNRDPLFLSILNNYHFNYANKDQAVRGLIMSRSSYVAAHRYPVHYSGKTTVSWDTLKSLPFYNSTSANIGISWWSHDVGGYKDGIEDWELYLRYVQLGVYSPIFRFSADYGHYYKREPWKWDLKTNSIVKDYCVVRQRLIPYLYTEAFKYAKTGLPLIQPLYYRYPEIYDEPDYKNEYYFGSELFVAPITKRKDYVMNRAVEKIFLPEGTWYDFKTGKRFVGNKRYVIFYKDEDYPVFGRSGSIIPMAKLEENINVSSPPKAMTIHIFPGKSNTYDLYEDDGYSKLNEDGYFIKTRIDYNYMPNNYTLIIRPVEGKSGIIPDVRDYKIKFRNIKEAEEVKVMVQETPVEFDSYTEENDFCIEIKGVSTVKQLSINCKGKDIEIDAVRIINEDIDSIISDLQIPTKLKEQISIVIFSDIPISKKRIAIRKLKHDGLKDLFVRMFLKLLEYVAEI